MTPTAFEKRRDHLLEIMTTLRINIGVNLPDHEGLTNGSKSETRNGNAFGLPFSRLSAGNTECIS